MTVLLNIRFLVDILTFNIFPLPSGYFVSDILAVNLIVVPLYVLSHFFPCFNIFSCFAFNFCYDVSGWIFSIVVVLPREEVDHKGKEL